ncbi:MAG: Ger(x)C family spore germination protein [Bacillota bacterium]|nr:Ger(x)C family spore germination protein [Bacillota bacterium]
MKKAARWFFLLVLLFPLTGCWDSIEPKSRAFVLAVGLDAAPAGKLRLTISVPTSSGMGSQPGSTGPSAQSYTLTAEGRTFVEATQNVQQLLERSIYYGEVQAIVFGADLAKRGLQDLTAELMRYPLLDPLIYAVISEGPAGDLIGQVTPGGRSVPRAIFSIYSTPASQAGVPQTRLWQVARAFLNPGEDAIMAALMKGPEGTVPTIGSAVFHAGKLVGLLSGDDNLGLSFLRGIADQATLTVPFAGKEVQILQASSRSRIQFLGVSAEGLPLFRAQIQVEGQVGSDPPGGAPWTPQELNQLERSLAEKVKVLAEESWSLLQERKSDVLLLGFRVHQLDPLLWSRLSWSETFPKVTLDIQVKATISRIGNRP